MRSTILWFRQDLRIQDNPALIAASEQGGPVIPVYIWAPHEEGDWAPGSASRWWLHHAVADLDATLRQEFKSRLVIRSGDSLPILRQLMDETGAEAIFWNRRYEPAVVQRDQRIKSKLRDDGRTVQSFNASLLFEPWTISTQENKPYQVFTPFWKASKEIDGPNAPCPIPKKLPAPKQWPESDPVEQLELLPKIPWDEGIRASWNPTIRGGRAVLDRFLADGLYRYDIDRDKPGITGTSRLSPYLHCGQISPRQIWQAVHERLESEGDKNLRKNADRYLSEIGWREFGYHLLYHFPHTTDEPLREKFADFPWKRSKKSLERWQQGQTGYPIVDAGMRELWHTGYMHNRVRMIVASFLVKDLLIPWQKGAKWFWDTLVDADLANNTLGWQWAAGCGADAAPYFRIFNPVSQGERYDPQGLYVRRWVPEASQLPDRYLHKPWESDPSLREQAGLNLDDGYPNPIVDHREARERALAAFEEIKGN